MAQTKTTIGSGTKIVGQVTSEEDLTVEGRIDGGPLRVRGRLTVAAAGAVSCEDTEVGDALVIGVFSGTLRARDVVRIHTTSGRVLGEIMAARVTFVSDQGLAALNAEEKAAPAADPQQILSGIDMRFDALSSLIERRQEDSREQGDLMFRELERRIDEVADSGSPPASRRLLLAVPAPLRFSPPNPRGGGPSEVQWPPALPGRNRGP